MARAPQIGEFKYKNGVLIRSAWVSWQPGKWPLGPGTVAYVANGPARIFLYSSSYLTIVTPQGETFVIKAVGPRDTAKAHQMAAEISRDAMVRPAEGES